MPLSNITDIYLMPDTGSGETNIGFISTGDLKLSFTETYNDVTASINTHKSDADAHGNTYIKKGGDTGVAQFTMQTNPVAAMEIATKSWVESAVTGGAISNVDDSSLIIASQIFS